MKIFQKYSATIATCLIACFAKHAVAENCALWDSHFMGHGDWSETTNWYCNSAPLPPPGYPDTNWHAEVFGETVTIASQDVSIISLQLSEYGKVAVTNGHSMTMARSIYTNGKRSQLCALDGTINVLDSLFSFPIGSVVAGHDASGGDGIVYGLWTNEMTCGRFCLLPAAHSDDFRPYNLRAHRPRLFKRLA